METNKKIKMKLSTKSKIFGVLINIYMLITFKPRRFGLASTEAEEWRARTVLWIWILESGCWSSPTPLLWPSQADTNLANNNTNIHTKSLALFNDLLGKRKLIFSSIIKGRERVCGCGCGWVCQSLIKYLWTIVEWETLLYGLCGEYL